MWLMTFTGKPRDPHVYEHAHESPWQMTVPLIALAALSLGSGWGWPFWDAKKSVLEGHLHHAQHKAVEADFGNVFDEGEVRYEPALKDQGKNERQMAYDWHDVAGLLALGFVAVGILFAVLMYWSRTLDPAEAQEQFPTVHNFLTHKWYFDELYSAVLVRPALVVATWCRNFDLRAIDGLINGLGRLTVWVTRGFGLFDNGVVDGLVNVVGNTTYSIGAGLRHVQTGFLRSYVLFLVLAAVGIFVALSYFVAG
jgi:NADH-quinone oxidoreductase subunit L